MYDKHAPAFVRLATRTAFIGALALVLPGCLAAAAGAAASVGAYAYSQGEVWSTVRGSLDDAYEATTLALDELGLRVVQEARDAFGAHVVATQVQGPRVSVDLVSEAERVTRIGVRVGLLGDEEKSRAILRAIRENL
jgi:hypothetical protein